MTATYADFEADLAALAWQLDLGADEAIGDSPLCRFETPAPEPAVETAVPLQPSAPAAAAAAGGSSEALAAGCADLGALRAAMAGFEGCALRLGAKNLVFADGHPGARVMIVGEAPGRDEDIAGLPFVGRSGQLLDRMFAAIGLSRRSEDPATAVYITNVLPWRPPGNREPAADEIAMMGPFLFRHIDLVRPEVLVLMGNSALRTVLGAAGITRARGIWADWRGMAVMPMFHPSALLRDPLKKRDAWADLLAVQARLEGGE